MITWQGRGSTRQHDSGAAGTVDHLEQSARQLKSAAIEDPSPLSDRHRLKVLVISMMYEPDYVGIAAIASDFCTGLADKGHDVTVYTSHPYYPEWKSKTQHSKWRTQDDILNGVKVRRHPIFVPSDPSRLFPRLLHEVSFTLSLMRRLFRRERFDLVMVFCPLMGSVAFASLHRMLFREPLWLNVQDIPVEAANASGIMRSGLFSRFASRVQRWMFNRADVWSSICPEMIEQLCAIKHPDRPIHLCPNWLTRSLQDLLPRDNSGCGPLPGEIPQLLYSGTIGKKQGLLWFCKELAKSQCNFRFQIRGDGSEACNIRRWVESGGDPRFKFGPLLPTAKFLETLAQAHWFVIPQKTSAGNSFFPSKLVPAITVGTPILAITEHAGPLGNEVSRNRLGLVVGWERINQIFDQLAEYHQEPARYQALQADCYHRAKVYNRQTAVARFETLFQELLSSRLTRSRPTNTAHQANEN